MEKVLPPPPRDGQQSVQRPFQPEMAEEPLRYAIFGQQQHPRVGLDDIAGPHRQHDRDIKEGLHFAAGVARHIPGHRQRQQGAGQGHAQRHHQGADDNVVVGGVEQCLQVGQRKVAGNRHGEVVKSVDTLPQQGQQRAQIDDAKPHQRPKQQQKQAQRRPAPEDPRYASGLRRNNRYGHLSLRFPAGSSPPATMTPAPFARFEERSPPPRRRYWPG